MTRRTRRRGGYLVPFLIIGALILLAVELLYHPAAPSQVSCSYSYASGVNFQDTGPAPLSCADIADDIARLGGGDLTGGPIASTAGPVVCQGTFHQDQIVVRDESGSESLGHQLCEQLLVQGMTNDAG